MTKLRKPALENERAAVRPQTRARAGAGAPVPIGISLMEARLRAAFEHLRESIVLTDPDDRFILVNRAFRELNANVAHAIQPGERFEDYIRAGLAAGNYPDAAGREEQWLAARLEERRNPGHPVERQRGGDRWFLIDDRRLPDGSTIRFGTEITERKRAERALQARNRELQLVVDSVPDMITRLDRDERFLFANRAYADLMGLPVEEIVGRRVADILPPDTYARIAPQIKRALAGDPVSVERQQSRPNGERATIEGRYIPDVDVEGRVIGMIAMHRDVTAERQAAESVTRSEARFRSLTALSSDWYWEQDEQFRYVYMSVDADARGAVSMTSRAGKTRWELPWTGVSEAQWAAHRAQLEAHEVFHDFEVGRPGPDGETIWVSVSGEPIFDDRGRFTGYRGITRNITERRRDEQRLRASEERFRRTFELAASGIAHVDLQGRFMRVNRSLCRILGRSADELVGRTVAKFSHPEDLGVTDEARRRMREGEIESEHFEKRYLRKDGATVWVDLTVALVRDARGEPEFEIAIFDDITERTLADAALRAQTERLQIGQAAARLIVLDWDVAGDWLTWSDSPEWLRGPLPASGRYPSFADQVHPEDRRHFLASRDAALQSRQDSSQEFRVVRTDGEVLWLLSRQKVFADGAGRSVRMLAALLDITERKRDEQALAESEARFRAIFERSNAAMAITDTDGAYLLVNAAFARFFGRSIDEIVGKLKVSDLRLADDAEGPALYRRLVSGEIGFYERDRPYLRKDGSQIWLRATVSAVRDPSGRAARVVAVMSDITEEVQARSRTERMNAELEDRVETRTAELRAAIKELDAFTYSVSHDLRAPIGAVSGFAHLLRSAEAERLSEDGLRLLGFIEHNAERMTRLIEGLLRFSRLGRSDLRRARVSMNGLVAESLLDFVDEAARARISAEAMPDCDGDPALLSQVWSNLLGNALKYSRGADQPRIDIGWDAGYSAYYVRDNGTGFDMAYAGKLFGVFERLHAEAEFEGSGIGLAIAERIVRLHGGGIWADAAPGRGATFWFTVPDAAGDAAPDARPSPPERR